LKQITHVGGAGTVLLAARGLLREAERGPAAGDSRVVRGELWIVTARTTEVMCGAVDMQSGHAAVASAIRLAGMVEPITTLVMLFVSVSTGATTSNQAISRIL
jgi:hypothetical protein